MFVPVAFWRCLEWSLQDRGRGQGEKLVVQVTHVVVIVVVAHVVLLQVVAGGCDGRPEKGLRSRR